MRVRELVMGSALMVVTAAAAPFVLKVDQEYVGPFLFPMNINETFGMSQGFVPTESRLDAVEVFLTGTGNNPELSVRVNIRDGSFDGPILGTSSISVPASLVANVNNPFAGRATFGTPVTLTPGATYYIQVDPDGGFLGITAAFVNGYPRGVAYVGDVVLQGLDFGFRTYFEDGTAPPPVGVGPPKTKDQCKDAWATFTIPRSFKNQGDCIQFVNTGK